MSWFTDLYRSAVGKKAVMAVTGIILFGFIVLHLIGNLKLYEPGLYKAPGETCERGALPQRLRRLPAPRGRAGAPRRGRALDRPRGPAGRRHPAHLGGLAADADEPGGAAARLRGPPQACTPPTPRAPCAGAG